MRLVDPVEDAVAASRWALALGVGAGDRGSCVIGGDPVGGRETFGTISRRGQVGVDTIGARVRSRT